MSQFGKLDVMFNNAGILGSVGPITDIERDGWLRTIDVLLNSVFYGIKHAARSCKIKGSAQSSILLQLLEFEQVWPHVYTAAKHAVVGLSQSVATELGPHGIRCNVIAPGGTVSGLTARLVTGDHQDLEKASKLIGANNPLRRAGTPEDIANAVLYLASDEAVLQTGLFLL